LYTVWADFLSFIFYYIKVRTEDTGNCSHPHPYRWGVPARLNQKLDDFTVLTGIEVDIKSDGSLDFSDEILSKLDVVIAAIHSGFKQESKIITERLIGAIQNRFVSIIAHPTGRLIGYRESYQVDINEIITLAVETGTILEMNAYPERLDLNDVYCQMAKEKGVQLAVVTDAHSIDGLEFMNLGVDVARRGWLEEKDTINTLPLDKLLKRLKSKRPIIRQSIYLGGDELYNYNNQKFLKRLSSSGVDKVCFGKKILYRTSDFIV